MADPLELLLRGSVIGLGGAALMDVWGLAARRALGVQGLDYALLGRWIGHLGRGRVLHESIASAEPISGEGGLGWVAHYSIGIAFELPLLAVRGLASMNGIRHRAPNGSRSRQCGPPAREQPRQCLGCSRGSGACRN